jgi:hypothetical protein
MLLGATILVRPGTEQAGQVTNVPESSGMTLEHAARLRELEAAGGPTGYNPGRHINSRVTGVTSTTCLNSSEPSGTAGVRGVARSGSTGRTTRLNSGLSSTRTPATSPRARVAAHSPAVPAATTKAAAAEAAAYDSVDNRGTERRVVRLRVRLRRWWAPAQWADDHPGDASERIGEPTQTRRVWQEAPKAYGEGLVGGQVDPTRDLKKR